MVIENRHRRQTIRQDEVDLAFCITNFQIVGGFIIILAVPESLTAQTGESSGMY